MPLYEICAVGNAEAARILLDHGANFHDDDVSNTAFTKVIIRSLKATSMVLYFS